MKPNIEGFPNYHVTEDGEVYNIYSGGLKRPFSKENGYLCTTLYRGNNGKKFYVHRLVAMAYVDNPESKPEVNHIDGDKTNNKSENLEWVTSSENKLKAVETGHFHKGSRHANSTITEVEARKIKTLLAEGVSVKSISLETGASESVVRHIRNGNSWNHI